MSPALIGVTFLLVLLFALPVSVRLLLKGSGKAPPPPPQTALKPVPPEAADAARALIARGRRIHAIKEIRQASGYGLQEAKDIADAIHAGLPVPESPQRGPREGPAAELAGRVRELRDGERIDEAVRLVAERTGMTEHEAARFVAALD